MTARAEWVFGGSVESGNTFMMVFGMDEAGAKGEIQKQLARRQNKPDMPEYNPSEVRAQKGFATGTGFVVSAAGFC